MSIAKSLMRPLNWSSFFLHHYHVLQILFQSVWYRGKNTVWTAKIVSSASNFGKCWTWKFNAGTLSSQLIICCTEVRVKSKTFNKGQRDSFLRIRHIKDETRSRKIHAKLTTLHKASRRKHRKQLSLIRRCPLTNDVSGF